MIKHRKNNEVRSMNILGYILKIARKVPLFFNYLAVLPPPTYICANFHDWIPSFICYYKKEVEKYSYLIDEKNQILKVVEDNYIWYCQAFNKWMKNEKQKRLNAEDFRRLID